MKKQNTKSGFIALLIAGLVLLTPFGASIAIAQTDSNQSGSATTTAPATNETGSANTATTAPAANNNTAASTNTDATTTTNVEHTGVQPWVWALLAVAIIGGIAYAMSRKNRVTQDRVTVVRTEETRRP